MDSLPLLDRSLDEPFARVGADTLSVAEYLADVAYAAADLPAARYLLPLTADRYRFLVLLGAALARGETLLLPG